MLDSRFKVGDTVVLTDKIKQYRNEVKPYRTTGIITHVRCIYDSSCHKADIYYDVKIGSQVYSHIPEYSLNYKDELYRTMAALTLMIALTIITTILCYLK